MVPLLWQKSGSIDFIGLLYKGEVVIVFKNVLFQSNVSIKVTLHFHQPSWFIKSVALNEFA